MADSNVVSIPQAVWIACNTPSLVSCIVGITFQYRKRYGLHAIGEILVADYNMSGFQYRKRYGLHAICRRVPWRKAPLSFQYRKRYGLHAMVRLDFLGASGCCFNTASGMDCMQ